MSNAQQGTLFGELLVRLGLVTPGQVEEALAFQKAHGQRLGEALVSLGHISREKLQAAVAEELGLLAVPSFSQPPLGEILIGLGYISEDQLKQALSSQQKDGRRLGEILVAKGHCNYRQIYEGLSLQQRMGPQALAPKEEVPSAEGARILVVDDSPLACHVVELGLSQLGYRVSCFQDPYEALEQIPRLAPDIVLTDLQMPGLDGAELCRRLKSAPPPAVPVIILTINDEESQRIYGLRAGADDYVHKGASMGELAARIDSLIRRTKEITRVRELFARYTSDAVVEEILKSGGVVLNGEKREVTAIFADIRDFTALSESMPPEQVVALLNSVLGRMADAVLTCGGTLDKFLGDGLMAVFGAPVGREDDALRALQAARMMMESVQLLNREAKEEFLRGARKEAPAELELGIGINTGLVVAGNLGSARRAEYTCIGDCVNVAARLCSLAKPGEILIGERTSALAEKAGPFEALAPARLKGKKKAVPVFKAAWYRANSVDRRS
ncbi:MAG: response regulator [Myxococcales bacterium]|nr:response regulator [Myxococcales bacterium]